MVKEGARGRWWWTARSDGAQWFRDVHYADDEVITPMVAPGFLTSKSAVHKGSVAMHGWDVTVEVRPK